MLSPKDFEKGGMGDVINLCVGTVLHYLKRRPDNIRRHLATTYNWEDYQAGFHLTALYKMGELQFCAKFNRGVCPATS